MQKKWYDSRTLYLAIVQGVLGTMVMVLSSDDIGVYLGVALIVKTAIDILMRFVTKDELVR